MVRVRAEKGAAYQWIGKCDSVSSKKFQLEGGDSRFLRSKKPPVPTPLAGKAALWAACVLLESIS